jgi:hypothetical protein
MADRLSISVDLNGEHYECPIEEVDYVRLEAMTGMSTQKRQAGDAWDLQALYQLAWICLRRIKVDAMPDTFEAFLDLVPVAETIGGESEGKVSDPAATTSS